MGRLLPGRIVAVVLLFLTSSLYGQVIHRAEYFFDTDPGVGNGSPLTVPVPGETVAFSASINTAGLVAGRHLLYIRTRASGGKWSLYEPREFFVETTVRRAEYFIDRDPGVENGFALTVPPGVLTFSAPIPTVGLTPGRHLLYIRTEGTDKRWSLYEPREFFIEGPERRAEYFIDVDPGVGQATPLNIAAVSNSTFNTSITIPALPDGKYNLYVRVKEASGSWSLHEPVTFIVDIALPIELLSFNAKKNAEGFVDLTWTTASEKNNDYFEVERWIKDDVRFPNDFVNIGRVDGYGTSSVKQNYAYRDYAVQSKSMYYRLKQVDLDGKFIYSPTVAVISDEDGMVVMVFPNPSTSSFTLQAYGKGADDLQVEIVDALGKQIETHHTVNGPLVFGTHWPSGLYVVRVKNSHKTMVLKISKAQ